MSNYIDFGIYGVESNGAEWQRFACPNCDNTRKHKGQKDLAVNIVKEYWFCHNCGWSGSLKSYENRRRNIFVPKQLEYPKIKDNTSVLYKYFETRGISKRTIDSAGVTLANVVMDGKGLLAIAFNYYYGENLVNQKYRAFEKKFSQSPKGQKIFYNINAVAHSKVCVITEGEIDALSFIEAGITKVISVPDGAPSLNSKHFAKKFEYIENCLNFFSDKERIYLATDTDEAGLRLREELARRLGKERCHIIEYPEGCKDANDVLVKIGKQELIRCVEHSRVYPYDSILFANDRQAELYNIYDNGFPDTVKTGFENLDNLIKFFPSDLTVITGIPSHGKSNFLDNLIMNISKQYNWRFGLFSPENKNIEIHLIRLAEIYTGKTFFKNYRYCMDKSELRQAVEFINENFYWIQSRSDIDSNCSVKMKAYTIDNILEATKWLVSEYGINALVIDPYNRVEHNRGNLSENLYIGRFLNAIQEAGKLLGIHIFLIAHPRKMTRKVNSNFHEVPTLYDISGSADFYNMTDNGMTIYRNQSIKSGILTELYTTVYIQKVKHKFVGEQGYCCFNFNSLNQTYTERSNVPSEDYDNTTINSIIGEGENEQIEF